MERPRGGWKPGFPLGERGDGEAGSGDDNSAMTPLPASTAHPSSSASTDAFALEGVTALPHLGVIRAQGEEAAKFLQGQLTQDFMLWPDGGARLAGYCSPKGRLLASFIAFKLAPDDFALVLSRDLLAPTLKRLQMFVLRAKVKLTDASEALELRGLAGNAARAALGLTAIDEPTPWSERVDGGAHAAALYPADGVVRALWLAPAGMPAPAGAAMPHDLWLWSEVRSGVATITAPVIEAFVPQMLNYESVGGVNFKKGCYPGQEVVARSQFRGQIKRRAFLAHASQPLRAGQEVTAEGDDQPCGMVAQAAPVPGASNAFVAIVSVSAQAVAQGQSFLVTDKPLALQPVAYALAVDL